MTIGTTPPDTQCQDPYHGSRLCDVEVVVLVMLPVSPAGTAHHYTIASDVQRVLMGTTSDIPYRHTTTVVLHQLILCRVCDAEVTLRLQTHQVSRP